MINLTKKSIAGVQVKKDRATTTNKLAKQGAVVCMGISLSALLFKKKKTHAIFGALSLACAALHWQMQKKRKK